MSFIRNQNARSWRRELNPRPADDKSAVIPTEPRQQYQGITMFPPKPAQATMLTSKHQSNRTRIVKVGPFLRSVRINADTPDSALFQFLDSIDQILDSHDRNVG